MANNKPKTKAEKLQAWEARKAEQKNKMKNYLQDHKDGLIAKFGQDVYDGVVSLRLRGKEFFDVLYWIKDQEE